MKIFVLAAILFAVICSSPVVADNNVFLLEDMVSEFTPQPSQLSVIWDNEYTIIRANIALTISASGGMVAWFEDGMFILEAAARGGVLADCLEWFYRFEGPVGQPDTVLVMAGSYDPPTHNGIPPGSGEVIYYLGINWAGDVMDAYIYIDSVASVPPDDGWLWEDSTFIFDPTFNTDGSTHEIHHVFYGCPPVLFENVPENDNLLGYYCAGATYTFEANPNDFPPDAYQIDSFAVISGPGTITKTGRYTGLYEVPPDTMGTYQVTVGAWSDCHHSFGDYSFTVILGQPCGDANGDCMVNVSDAVAIINYVFVGGDPPNPICLGDVNGDAHVGVSDAVYIINYVFVGGARPVTDCCDE